MAFVIGAIVVVVIIFVVGFATTVSGGTSNQGNDNIEGCEAACRNLVAKRAQVCSHRAAVATATANRNSAVAKVAGATAAAVAAAAAAAAAVFIPIVGPIIAPILAAASVVAWGYLDFVLGQLAGTASQLQVQLDGLNQAVALEAQATDMVMKACPADTAQACIASLQPCPV